MMISPCPALPVLTYKEFVELYGPIKTFYETTGIRQAFPAFPSMAIYEYGPLVMLIPAVVALKSQEIFNPTSYDIATIYDTRSWTPSCPWLASSPLPTSGSRLDDERFLYGGLVLMPNRAVEVTFGISGQFFTMAPAANPNPGPCLLENLAMPETEYSYSFLTWALYYPVFGD